jgi:hypothetical protein
VDALRPRWVFPALELIAEVPFKRGNIALNAGVELPLNDRDRYDWRL